MQISLTKTTEVGTFIITDPSYLEQFAPQRAGHVVSVPNGEYMATINVTPIDNAPFAEIPQKKGKLVVKTGKIYVGDPGAFFRSMNKWHDFLRATRYMKRVPQGTLIIPTSGDGKGKIDISLKPCGK